jgi:hypothetical protein
MVPSDPDVLAIGSRLFQITMVFEEGPGGLRFFERNRRFVRRRHPVPVHDPAGWDGDQQDPENEGLDLLRPDFQGLHGLKSYRSDPFAISDEIRMSGFMHQTDEVNGVSLDLVADVERKRTAMLAGKAVWTDMVATFPADDGSHRIFNPFMQISAKTV